MIHGEKTEKKEHGPGAWENPKKNWEKAGRNWWSKGPKRDRGGKRRRGRKWMKNFISKTKAVCRAITKKGECPWVETYSEEDYNIMYDGNPDMAIGHRDWCKKECESDVDCSGILKCCQNECGSNCVVPNLEGDCEIANFSS